MHGRSLWVLIIRIIGFGSLYEGPNIQGNTHIISLKREVNPDMQASPTIFVRRRVVGSVLQRLAFAVQF